MPLCPGVYGGILKKLLLYAVCIGYDTGSGNDFDIHLHALSGI